MNFKNMATFRNQNYRKLRRKLIEKQGNKCYYCNITFDKNKIPTSPSLDHVVPFCYVGHKTKMVACCRKCNLLKGNISEELYRAGYVQVNIKPWYNEQSYNIPMKVRKPINWFQETFPQWFWWNNRKFKIVIKLYED